MGWGWDITVRRWNQRNGKREFQNVHQALEVGDGLKARKEDSRNFLQKAKEGTAPRVRRKDATLLTNSLDVQKVHVCSQSSPA